WVMGELAAALNAADTSIDAAAVRPAQLAALLARLLDGTVNAKGAKEVFAAMWAGGAGEVDALIEARGLKQISDVGAIEALIDEVLAANARMVEEFRSGKEKAFNALVGQAMRATQGKANPAQVNEILRRKLAG
ncbi:MAG: Asp-tRNA(Asn)/Glu-tRNA(Gln) amidotransferase GatCAB subunit B, partial [Betaproteobacteria bacterium]